MLKNITNSKLEHVKRAMFMHRSVAMLLALYIDDLSRTNQDATPRYIFSEDEMARLRAMVEVLGTAKYRNFSARKVARIFGFSYCKAVEGIRWICNGKDIRTITNERIADEIAQRLIETNDTLEQIAVDMELGETSNVRRSFRRVKGVSPTEYRKKNRRDQN